MTSPFLITHLVRGQPAFDIAEQMTCPICKGDYDIDRDEESMCADCDDTGYWWIIPTSGHRAYPYKQWELTDLEGDVGQGYWAGILLETAAAGLPDHYSINNRALRSAPSSSLADRLGLNLRQSSAPIRRRV